LRLRAMEKSSSRTIPYFMEKRNSFLI
jgi:hypothetical protein